MDSLQADLLIKILYSIDAQLLRIAQCLELGQEEGIPIRDGLEHTRIANALERAMGTVTTLFPSVAQKEEE